MFFYRVLEKYTYYMEKPDEIEIIFNQPFSENLVEYFCKSHINFEELERISEPLVLHRYRFFILNDIKLRVDNLLKAPLSFDGSVVSSSDVTQMLELLPLARKWESAYIFIDYVKFSTEFVEIAVEEFLSNSQNYQKSFWAFTEELEKTESLSELQSLYEQQLLCMH